jgi:putative thioredoxin
MLIGENAGPAAEAVKDTTTAGFAKDVLEASKKLPVLVHFTSDRSQACKLLTPLLDKLVKEQAGKIRLVRMNVDTHPTIPGQLRIQQLPTVYAFVDGRPVDGFQGAQPEMQVRALIDRIAGDAGAGDLTEALAAAQQALDANDLQAAAEIYAAIIEQDGQNPAALAGLATCYTKRGDLDRADQTLALVPPDKAALAIVSQVRAAIALARQAGSAVDTTELEARIAANPKDHQARLDLAKALASQGKKEAALDHLIESIRHERKWNDEAARKQLVQFLDAWGPKDPMTSIGRRKLSSVWLA